MKIILSRHGNTFKPGEPAVWVGSTNDVPLVASGLAQAHTLGQALKNASIVPAAVYCGPLQRTRVYAQTVLAELGLAFSPIIDERLNEINYGQWAGLTNDQIRAKFGAQALIDWEQYSQWPLTGGWPGSALLFIEQVKSFSHDLIKNHSNNDTILIISSNGCLRYFLDLIPGEFQRHIAQQNFKVATGNISQLTYADHKWALDFWDQPPATQFKIQR